MTVLPKRVWLFTSVSCLLMAAALYVGHAWMIPKTSSDLGPKSPSINEPILTLIKSGPEPKLPLELERRSDRSRDIVNLSRSIMHLIRTRGAGVWYQCGIRITYEDHVSRALELATALLDSIDSVDDALDPYGIVGVMYHESRLDPCALGLHPRKAAYADGVLRKRRTTISHTASEVLATMGDPTLSRRFAQSGYDLGLCQILTRFYADESPEYIMTIGGGTRICVMEMHARATKHDTRVPWAYWPGHRSEGYARKIGRIVRVMKGAVQND